MSVRDLKQQLQSMTPAERREVAELLVEIEASSTPEAAPKKARNFNEALDYVFTNFDTALRKLAQ